MSTLVLTVVGEDRVGLVRALAETVSTHGGSWQRSHLAELAGTFAGVVVVTVPDRQEEQLRAAVVLLDGLLEVSIRAAGIPSAPVEERRRIRLELLGNDRPGIVAAVSGVFAEHGLGVVDLQTETRPAPMAGGTLFEAVAVLSVDSTEQLDAVRTSLEALTAEVLVDFSVAELD